MCHTGQVIDSRNRMRTLIVMIMMAAWNIDLNMRKIEPMGSPPYKHGIAVGEL